MDKLSPPTPMPLTGNLTDNWRRFKQRFNIYMAASGCGAKKDDKVKASILLHVIGEDALDIYNSFQLDDNASLDELMDKFEEYFVPKQNITFERYTFFSCDQKQALGFDQYLAELHTE